MSDRSLAIWGIGIGIVGLVMAVFSVWFSFIAPPWGTKNDHFCYRIEAGVSCFLTRANCDARAKMEPMKITRQCERDENPFVNSN
jgi:hypothetical protein